MGVGGLGHAPAALHPGKEQVQSGRVPGPV